MTTHGSTFKARVWHKSLWRAYTTCSLEISMHNRWQESAYLESQVLWVNRHFKKCFVHVGDTLHRHNLLNRLSPEDAHMASYIMGSSWLARNEHILECLTIPFEIIRWDKWRNSPSFPALRTEFQNYYDTNRFFRGIVARDVTRFLTRNPSVDPSRCVDYLLEEATGDTLFCRENEAVRVYPASELTTYSHLSKTQIPEHLKGLDRSVRVRVSFHRRRDGGALSAPETPQKRIEMPEETGFSDRSDALPAAE